MGRDPGFSARRYIAIATEAVLLIWDPLDRFLPPWLALRLGCLSAIPLATWLLLQWAWKAWQPGYAAEDRISRALYATTAGALLALAIHFGYTKTHVGGPEWAPEVLPGPDRATVAITLMLAGAAFWFSVAPDEKLNAELEQVSSLVVDLNLPVGEKYWAHMSNGRKYPISQSEYEKLKIQHLDLEEM